MHVLLSLQVVFWPPEIQSDKKKNVCRKGWTGQKEAVWSFHLSSCIKQASKHYSEIPLARSFSELPLPLWRVRKKSRKKPNLIDLCRAKFPRCLGAEQKKIYVFLCYKHDCIPAQPAGLIAYLSSINMLLAFYAWKRWPIALAVNRSPTQECLYKPAFSVWSHTGWPQSVVFQRILQTYHRTAAWCTSTSFVLIDIDYKQA